MLGVAVRERGQRRLAEMNRLKAGLCSGWYRVSDRGRGNDSYDGVAGTLLHERCCTRGSGWVIIFLKKQRGNRRVLYGIMTRWVGITQKCM